MDCLCAENIIQPQANENVQTSPLLLQSSLQAQVGHNSKGEITSELNENDKMLFEELKELIFKGNWEELMTKLLEFPSFPIDAQSSADHNYTLLHHAAERRNEDCIRVLVDEFCANPNIKAVNGWTPMHLVVISDCRCENCTEKTLKSLQILLNGGAHVDSEDDIGGETPLYFAARNRLIKPTEFLLNNGANINHWVNGTSVATVLAQFVPDVLKTEFDKRITIHEKETKIGLLGLRLDFSLLLQDVAIHEGFTVRNSSDASRRKRIFTSSRTKPHGSRLQTLLLETGTKLKRGNYKAGSHDTSTITMPPKETELLNYILRADLSAVEAVVNHPYVEAFVHLKWLSVRKVFLFFRSLYLFLISLYTFYVFDTFVNVTCFYNITAGVTANASISPTGTISLEKVDKITGKETSETVAIEKAPFGVFFPTASSPSEDTGQEQQQLHTTSYREWSSFSEYFKAHEMSCEPTLRTTILASIFAAYVICTVLYELYKLFESWYDYFKSPINFAWWILAINIAATLTPGMGIYAHTWHYPHAAFTLVYGWILVLEQIGRIPYFGVFVGIFVKVLKDFSLLLLTFSPVLLAFALGFSVMLPQNEFFRFIPLGFFKVFMMMTGDIDFWGVFAGTWTSSTTLKGHLHFPLFLIYAIYILIVTMVLMSLLLGLAVDNIQEVRREAALNRIVRLIQEIGIFESIFYKSALYYCGCSRHFRRIFSITSLDIMNGCELITFPEDPNDKTLPPDIKNKLLPYLIKSCCCSAQNEKGVSKKFEAIKKGEINEERNVSKNLAIRKVVSGSHSPLTTLDEKTENKILKPIDQMKREFFEAIDTSTQKSEIEPLQKNDVGRSSREYAIRDLMLYKEIDSLLEEHQKLKDKLKSLKRKLINRK